MNAQEKKRLEDLRKAQLAKNGGNGKAAAASKRLDTLGTRRGAPSVPTASSSSSSAPSLPAKSRLAPRKSSASRRIFVPNQKKKAAGKKPTTSIIPTRKTRKFRPNPSSKTPKRRQAQLTSRVAFTASNSRRSTGGWSNTVAKYVKNEAGSIAEVQQAITRREIKKDRNRVKLEAKDDSKQINAMEEEDVEEEEDDEYEGGHESQYPPIILPFDLPVNRQQQQMKEDTVANISKLNRNRSKIIEDDEEEEDDKEDEKEKLKAPKSKLNQIGGSSSSSTCLSLAQHLQRTIKMSQEESDESPNPEIFFLQLPTALPILDAKEKEADETIKKEEGAITVKSEPMDGRVLSSSSSLISFYILQRGQATTQPLSRHSFSLFIVIRKRGGKRFVVPEIFKMLTDQVLVIATL
mmetsp:Transcript_23291/g.37416  ORF Transcript_23291/g.37416 Transcript_23291/m.37416 type:complete len:407 (+) Transcript_23291:64-1284(+)